MKNTLFLLVMMATTSYTQTPPPALQAYDFVVGRWDCKGVTPAGKVDYTFTQAVDKQLGGRWFRFQAVSDKGKGISFMTYEPKTHLWRYLHISDSGAYSIGTGQDFVGNKQTWTGYTYNNGARKSWGRIVFTKISDREKREDFYQPLNSGKNQFVGSEVCSKLP